MKRYTHTPAHPDIVAGLNDRTVLRGLSERLDQLIDGLTTHPARQALMDSRAVINAAVKSLTP
jgi:hypothetical protein